MRFTKTKQFVRLYFKPLLTQQMQARFEENSWRFPGFALVERPIRVYPYNVAAQMLGYINEVSPADIEAIR